ncbi:MAG: OmpH family outer membrane protein [Succinivibrionaceae bacterium]|nr:OmpH family outer membrane protein [Succinivibrionaceae bacterium]
MKKLLASVALSVSLVCAPAAFAGAPTSVAVINLAKIMSEIPQSAQVKKKLESEFAGRQAEMKKLNDQYVALVEKLKKNGSYMKEQEQISTQRKAQELQSQLQIKGQALMEDQRRRVAEEETKLMEKVGTAIEKIAKQRGYDVVLRGEMATVYFSDSIDISKDVIQLVSKSN